MSREKALRGCLHGIVFVIASPIVRAGLTAIFWVKPLPCPHAVVATMAGAWDWAHVRCVEAGLPGPPMMPASER